MKITVTIDFDNEEQRRMLSELLGQITRSAPTETNAGAGVQVPAVSSTKERLTPPAEAESGAVPFGRKLRGPYRKTYQCPVCHRWLAPQGKRTHQASHESSLGVGDDAGTGEEPAGEETPLRPPSKAPEPVSQPPTRIRLTDKVCVSAVDATLDGKTMAQWAEANRFRGNLTALTAWVNTVVRSTNRAAWKAMLVADQERYVIRAIGGKINEAALAGEA